MTIMMRSLQIIFLLLVVFCLCNLVASADVSKYKGENFTMKCPAPQADALGVRLYMRRSVRREVFYYHFGKDKLTLHSDYTGRVEVKNDKKTVTIGIFNLRLEDTGFYWCNCTTFTGTCKIDDSGDFLVVQENPAKISPASSISPNPNGMNALLIPVAALTAGSVLLLLLLVLVVWMVPKMKKLIRDQKEEAKRSGNEVYEIMTIPRRKDFT